MSSRVCKTSEGEIFPLRLRVHRVEDSVDDAIGAGHVDEADAGPGATPHFDEAALDHMGCAQLAPQVSGESEERELFGQVALQPQVPVPQPRRFFLQRPLPYPPRQTILIRIRLKFSFTYSASC